MMARYIFIDRNSGYIWGDMNQSGSPCEVARALDESLGARGYTYTETSFWDNQATYDLYSPNQRLPITQDGHNQELIDKVLRECRYVCTIERKTTPTPKDWIEPGVES
jgi:hypothetical protein